MTPSMQEESVAVYLDGLARSGFCGEMDRSEGTRVVYATDNSIYHMRPGAVIWPSGPEDVKRAVRIAGRQVPGTISLAARGGATGTNGQALTSGIVVDFSRHMNRVLRFDPAALRVTVQPGVVLDQLNTFLKPHGLVFPPTVSTASRATIGGMVATDASGKGSRIYGRTSDYIEALDVVLADGTAHRIAAVDSASLDALCKSDTRLGAIYREARRIAKGRRELIAATFPRMNRGLTGYNLQGMTANNGRFDLTRLLAGSEGTLALTTAITLRLRPLPKFRALAVLGYGTFAHALNHVGELLVAEPAAIEILDDKILSRAKGDILWESIAPLLDGADSVAIGGLNFLEFVGGDAAAVEDGLQRMARIVDAAGGTIVFQSVTTDTAMIAGLWELRKKSVGLMGRPSGSGQGVPFVEDTAVPPERLVEYVIRFRSLLDRYGLEYGMFGHADVGCLHVRPVLDMTDGNQRRLVRLVSDEVAALVKRHGGLLWGEHGRGFRGEYSPFFFGPELYAELCRLKAAFDPANLFNPGKLAAPGGGAAPLDRIDEIPFRGERDAQIAPELAHAISGALACNGNGACHNVDRDSPMCPSYKASNDRSQSPKGRASLLREWALLRSRNNDPSRLAMVVEALDASLATCLACKSCASECPVQVDIPAMRSRYLEWRAQSRRRLPRDHIAGAMESLTGICARAPKLANALSGSAIGRFLLARAVALVDLPTFSAHRPEAAVGYSRNDGNGAFAQSVILLQDSFTSRFDAEVPVAAYRLLSALGYRVLMPPVMPNGKAVHTIGKRQSFEKAARRMVDHIGRLRQTGLPLVALEPVTALMHAHEYREVCSDAKPVETIDSFLAGEVESGRLAGRANAGDGREISIFLHCTEKTMSPATANRWARIFKAFGVAVEFPRTGCCGMAGLFGHEIEHRAMSQRIFDMSWKGAIEKSDGRVQLATGFSCRCQTKRFGHARMAHPVEYLLEIIERIRSEGREG